MAAKVQVVIEAQDAASGVLRGITSQLGGIGSVIEQVTSKNVSWGNVATEVATVVVNGLVESYNAAQQYSQSVRDLALVSGVGAEESSRLIQVLDDFQISAEDVTAATRAMTKQGLTPTIETLAQLSDAYKKINDPMEKNKFIIENLGRAGLQWVNALNAGGDALRSMGAEVSANLILTDKQVANMEKARLAQDAWNDTIEGGKIAIGAWIGGMVAANDTRQKAIALLNEEGIAYHSGIENSQAYKDALLQVEYAELGAARSAEEHGARLDGDLVPALNNAADATAELSKANAALIKDAISIQDSTDKYQDSQAKIAAQISKLSIEKSKMSKNEKEEIAKITEKIDDLKNKYAENADAFEEAQQRKLISMSLEQIALSDGVAGFSEAEAAKAEAILETAGVAEAAAFREARAFDAAAAAIANGTLAANDLKELLEAMEKGYTIEIAMAVVNGSGPGVALPSDYGQYQPRQIGGTVYAGNAYRVGEAGSEPFFPSQNGRIIGHAEALHAMTLGGGGGGANYFYGNVSLQIGADEAGSLMEMR